MNRLEKPSLKRPHLKMSFSSMSRVFLGLRSLSACGVSPPLASSSWCVAPHSASFYHSLHTRTTFVASSRCDSWNSTQTGLFHGCCYNELA